LSTPRASSSSPSQARELIRLYRAWVRQDTSADTVLRATEIAELARLSFWDSLIVAAAEEVGCEELLSEDMGHGQQVAGVRIVNPFA
jgi:predicted nucleic acid-binding protein